MSHVHKYKKPNEGDIFKFCSCGKRRKIFRKPSKKSLRKACDAKWSKVTKLLSDFKFGKKCLWCGSTENLQSDHIINRHHTATRWNPDNCVVLCYPCHIYRKKREPSEWFEVVKGHVPDETYQAIRLQSREIVKNPDYDGILYGLSALEIELLEKIDQRNMANL